MVVAGLIAHIHNGIYYVRCNGDDSHPGELGEIFAYDVPTESKKFEDSAHRIYQTFEGLLRHVAQEIKEGYKVDLDYYGSEFYVMPDTTVPITDSSEDIRWVYTIDFDRMCFSVNNGAHFRLSDLPRGGTGSKSWIKYLSLDGMGTNCTDPCTPAEFVADLFPLEVKSSPDGLKAWEEYSPRAELLTVDDLHEVASEHSLCSHDLAVATCKTVLNLAYGTLCNVCQYPPEDSRFQDHAKALLMSIAPLYTTMTFDEKSITLLCRVPNVNADASTNPIYYRFRGCLIQLCTRLDTEEYLQAAIGDMITRLQDKNGAAEECTALLWSIRHFVVVRKQGYKIFFSTAIPVLPVFRHDDNALAASLNILAYFLRPVQTMGDDKSPPGTTETPCIGDSIFQKLKTLPLDVTLRIMGYCDPEDLWQFGQLSCDVRTLWIRQARIGPYTVLPSGFKSLPSTIGTLARFTANDDEGVLHYLELAYCGAHLRNKNPETDSKFKERSEKGKKVYLNFHSCPSYPDKRGQLFLLDSGLGSM